MSQPLAIIDNVIPLRRLGTPGPDAMGSEPSPRDEAEDDDDSFPRSSKDDEGHGDDPSPRRGEGRRRAWLRECVVIAGSYALNGLLLSAFAFIGVVSWTAGLLYTLPGLLSCALAAWLVATRRTEHLRDPSLSVLHALTSVSVGLLGVALYPQMAFAYALMLFSAFVTATYRMPRWQVQAMLVSTATVFAALTLGRGHWLRISNASTAALFVNWLFFTTTLGRCVMLSVINARNNRMLRDRGLQMKATLAQIERLANHDELTGVLNRRRLLQILKDEMDHTDRNGTPLSVALFDLDHFKAVNDTLGHHTGDLVLKQFAAAVQGQARNTDRFGRYGGEEFLLILTGADLEHARQAVERTRNALSLVDWGAIAPELRVTFSAGIATYRDQESMELLLGRADLGLYEAKHDGRNCTRAA